MEQNLVIVESPAKAKTIEKFLGKDFLVKSSFGHVRDLEKKNLGIDLAHNYEPHYIVSEDKGTVVADLKRSAKQAETVWLASDEDREGEAIAWHLAEVLGLKKGNTKRIVFNEITKEAILHAVQHPRDIDKNLVDAQQARRVLDRLVGFELSPVLWKKVKPSLSAGRVQSVAVRLLVEREREILNFKPASSFKINGKFLPVGKDEKNLNAELNTRFDTPKETLAFLEKCKSARYQVSDVTTKPSRKSPAPPFTTSTLQQEASRKLGFSVGKTMTIAQRLYEAGKITYMRTDSVNLADVAINTAQTVIASLFGKSYVFPRQYKTKSKGAQEAHEAIRPTYLDKPETAGSWDEKRLYELIWKRTIASQMSDAQLERTVITIDISTTPEKFVATGEVIKFDGFLKLYIESVDDENEDGNSGLLPPMRKGENLEADNITAIQRFTHHPPRYTEASLVKKLEELGIGRPSTYAPTISTIQQRGYVTKEDKPGTERKFVVFTLTGDQIQESIRTEMTGVEKAKLFPSDVGMIVNDFLLNHFTDVMDYNFTASVEKEFDEIAEGKLNWTKMIDKFYRPFHDKVDATVKTSERSVGERKLGIDPESGKPVIAKIGKYGPLVQIGEASDVEKPRFAGLLKNQRLDTITLEEALQLFRLPRKVGQYEGKDIAASVGRFGPYLLHNSKFYSLRPATDNPLSVTLERAIEVIEAKREADRNRLIKTFKEDAELQILKGRFGPYLCYRKENYKLPVKKDAELLSYDECMKIVAENADKPRRKTSVKKTAAEKPEKKSAKKKKAAAPKAATPKTAVAKKPSASRKTAAAKTVAKKPPASRKTAKK
ncbi:MAG: type I DNA topoisomerase [Bacteroidales bacterium]|jgi:DNA topoisomerase-1|nr:type I DNA topoisomerase [Bacteroidales bacterium]